MTTKPAESRVLLETCRTERDFEEAYMEFLDAEALFKETIFNNSSESGAKLLGNALALLRKSFDMLDLQSSTASTNALQTTIRNLHPRLVRTSHTL